MNGGFDIYDDSMARTSRLVNTRFNFIQCRSDVTQFMNIELYERWRFQLFLTILSNYSWRVYLGELFFLRSKITKGRRITPTRDASE